MTEKNATRQHCNTTTRAARRSSTRMLLLLLLSIVLQVVISSSTTASSLFGWISPSCLWGERLRYRQQETQQIFLNPLDEQFPHHQQQQFTTRHPQSSGSYRRRCCASVSTRLRVTSGCSELDDVACFSTLPWCLQQNITIIPDISMIRTTTVQQQHRGLLPTTAVSMKTNEDVKQAKKMHLTDTVAVGPISLMSCINSNKDTTNTNSPKTNHQHLVSAPSLQQRLDLQPTASLPCYRRNMIGSTINRRNVLFSPLPLIASSIISTATPSSLSMSLLLGGTLPANAAVVPTTGQVSDLLEQLSFANGKWTLLDRSTRRQIRLLDDSTTSGMIRDSNDNSPELSSTAATVAQLAFFCTYASRFLIRYDPGVASWWDQQQKSYALLSSQQRCDRLEEAFGSLARSIQGALLLLSTSMNDQNDLDNTSQPPIIPQVRVNTSQLWDLLDQKYGYKPDARRQMSLLFALLPPVYQPIDKLMGYAVTNNEANRPIGSFDTEPQYLTSFMRTDYTQLLPGNYQCIKSPNGVGFLIQPFIPMDDGNPFGPISPTPLIRDIPNYPWTVYALFGLAGATGCCLTHTVVIPLDVVKTRAQTDPDKFGKNLWIGAQRIVREEGFGGLLLGSQATIAGYGWYGLTVYPSYTFVKRFLTETFFTPDIALSHTNDIALVAGACSAILASLGLTPLEACRIRAVAEPQTYKPLGLTGTLTMIAREDPTQGWKTLYAGLPSLMVRQIIFGSVKFLAFERTCELIFSLAPILRDATWSTLMVSLVAGGVAGALSSVVSQPADSVLTYVAKNSDSSSNLGIIEGCQVMVQREGIGALFRGLGSRSLWAGTIIAGQFLLYDIIRDYFGVSSDDLSQVFQVILPESQPPL